MGAHVAALSYVDREMDSVEGWFEDTEARAFIAVDHSQRRSGVTGDVLEIGAYLGKSAILLGFFLQPGEQLVVSDLFGVEAVDEENRHEMERFYECFTLDGFLRNFGRFHGWTPEVLRGPSAETLSSRADESCRFVHIDGSHNFEAVRADIAETRRLLRPGGIVIFDDLFAVHAPGVQAAVWEAVSDGLVPIAIAGKLYASWTPDDFDRRDFTQQLEVLGGVVVAGTIRIRGYEVIEFMRDPSWRVPSKLRRRLALLVPPAVPRLVEFVDRRRQRTRRPSAHAVAPPR